MNQPNKRRVFYSYDKENFFQIFSFAQEKDGSIYCKWPDFTNTRWVRFEMTGEDPVIRITDSPSTSEKLSLHGSGVVKFKQSNELLDPERIKGYYLYKDHENRVAPRHLFTGFMSEPKYLPKSNYKNRKSDIEILAREHNPYVVVFFAVPQQKTPIRIHFRPSFDIDLMGEDFLQNIGFGSFSLAYHDVIWFAYKTANIVKWPKNSHVFYYDGFLVPLFIGSKPGNDPNYGGMIVVLQEPQYILAGNDFFLILPFPDPKEMLGI